jgi:hypothetical protein
VRYRSANLSTRLRLTDLQRSTLAEIGKRLGRQALQGVACVAKPETIALLPRMQGKSYRTRSGTDAPTCSRLSDATKSFDHRRSNLDIRPNSVRQISESTAFCVERRPTYVYVLLPISPAQPSWPAAYGLFYLLRFTAEICADAAVDLSCNTHTAQT